MFRKILAGACAGVAVAALSAQGAAPRQPAGSGLIVGQVVDATTKRGIADVAVSAALSRDVRPGGTIAGPLAVLTNAEGHFVLRGLPAGTYLVTGRRSGYMETLYGAAAPGGEGKPIAIGEGGRYGDATIRLWKLATIGGTIVDEAGEPIIGLQVRALKRLLTAGRWRFGEYYSNIKYGARTDDRGMYRITDLEPGDYVVSVPVTSAVAPASLVAELEALRADPATRESFTAASEAFSAAGAPVSGPGLSRTVAIGDHFMTLAVPGLAPIAPASGPVLMYSTQFFPSVTAASRAQVIAVKAGEERPGIDFSLKPVRTSRVSGTVIGPNGPVSSLAMRLTQNDGDSVLQETDVATTVSGASGAFAFVGVPAGQYVVRVLRVARLPAVLTRVGTVSRVEQSAGASPEPTLWANVPVSVGDADVTDVTVTLSTGVRASGRVVFDGTSEKPPPAQLASLGIGVELADGRRPSRYGDDAVRLTGDTFMTPELAPGKYIVRPGSFAAWRMKSAMAGARDVSVVPLVVDGRDIPPITITFVDRPLASLTGTVRTSANAAADAVVFLFPIERDAWVDYGTTPVRLRRAQVANAGVYTITSVPAGSYFVAALAEDRAADWRDPAFLDALARVATRVTIADEETKTLDLKIERVPSTGGDLQQSAIARHAGASPPARGDDPSRSTSGPFADDDEWQQQPARDTTRAAPAPAGTAAISGVVVSDDAGATPVRRVVVTMVCTDPRVGRTVVTDDSGRFSADELPAGQYALAVTKPGFIDIRYGASKPGRPGTPITLAADERRTVSIRIMRGAVITGTVRDARGEPMRRVSVSAIRYEFSNGERQLASAGRSQEPTDDRGQYRIFGLEPGEYFVNVERPNVGVYRSLKQTTAEDLASAQRELRTTGAGAVAPPPPAAGQSPPAADMGYAAVFHPGTPRLSQASAVTVGMGEERAGVDIAVELVALAQIRAKVVGPDGQPPAMVQARVVPVTALPGLSLVGLDAGVVVPVTDGNVRISGIPPGEYVLHVGGSSTPPAPRASSGSYSFSPTVTLGLPMFAMVPLTIDGRDVDDLTVRLEQAKSVKGRVVFDGATPAPNLSTVQIALRGPRLGGVTLSNARAVLTTPEFTLDSVVPASYVVVGTVRGWMVKSAIVNGRDASDLPVEISTDVTDAAVTFTDKLTELSGVLQTPAGTPAPNYYIIVFPKDPAFWLIGTRRIVSLRPATDGRFATTAANPLPPGDYLIAAVTDVRSGEWFDPAFLAPLAAAAIPVTIGEGEKKKQKIQIR